VRSAPSPQLFDTYFGQSPLFSPKINLDWCHCHVVKILDFLNYCPWLLLTHNSDDPIVLGSAVLIGQHIALVSPFISDLDCTNAQTPRELSRALNAVVDIILKCHILRQSKNARRSIPHHVCSLPAHLSISHKVITNMKFFMNVTKLQHKYYTITSWLTEWHKGTKYLTETYLWQINLHVAIPQRNTTWQPL